MASDTKRFVADLKKTIAARRSFGGHPLWKRIEAGAVPVEGLRLFAQQFFLQVREFPRAVSALHAKCLDAAERIELAESLYEEETGRISGCDVSHPELFVRFGEAVGLKRRDLVEALPLASTAALIHWFELATKERSFLEGAAAINLASEGQVPGAFGPFAKALRKRYGLSKQAVAFWDIHEVADREHSDIGKNVAVRHATTPEAKRLAKAALEESLAMWWGFFDGMERAIGVDAGKR